MFDRVLSRMREKVRSWQYVMMLHAEEEMDADEMSIFDVEHCILNGKITERQKDKLTAEWKYRITGRTVAGRHMEVIAKLGATGKLVIITVYSL